VSSLAVSDFDRQGFPDLAAVESAGSVDVLLNTSPRAGLQMAVSPASATAGVARSVTVSAFDLAGNPNPVYTGTAHFTSSDYQAVLPADYTFTAADSGLYYFAVILRTAGSQTVTATDTHAPALTGQTAVNVLPTASLSGPATGTVHQDLTFTLSASGGASASTVFT